MDHVDPDCEVEGKGCIIPDCSEAGARGLELKQRIRALEGLIPGGDVVRFYGYDLDDVDMLVTIEEELRNMAEERKDSGEQS